MIQSSTCASTALIVDIKNAQAKLVALEQASEGDDGIFNIDVKLRIPNEAMKIKLMIEVKANSVGKERRAYAAKMDTICSEYYWDDTKVDIKQFTKSCLQYINSRHEGRLPGPPSTAFHS